MLSSSKRCSRRSDIFISKRVTMSRLFCYLSSLLVILIALLTCYSITVREKFEFLSVLHTKPKDSDGIPLCLDDVPDSLLSRIQNVQPSGLLIVTNCSIDKKVSSLRVMNSTEVAATRSPYNDETRPYNEDWRVFFACSSKRSLVLFSTKESDNNGIVPLTTAFSSPSLEFNCLSPGAKYIVDYIRDSISLNRNSTSFITGTISLDPKVINCVMVNSSNASIIPSSMQLWSYTTKELKVLLRVKAPFVRCMGVYTRDVYPLYTENEGIISLACAEDLFVTPAEYESRVPLTLLTEELLLKEDNSSIALNTYYSRYFDYTPVALEALQTASRKIKKVLDVVNGIRGDYGDGSRGDYEELEGYENSIENSRNSRDVGDSRIVGDIGDLVVDVRVPSSLESAYDGNVRIVSVPSTINGIPLRVSDRVILKNQRVAENGKYTVVKRDVKRDVAILMDVIPIDLDTRVRVRPDENGTLFFTLNRNLNISLSENSRELLLLRPKDVVYVIPLKKLARVVEESMTLEESMKLEVLDLTDSETRLKFDKKSHCSDTTIGVKELCESPFDSSGSPKIVGSWDKPCLRDHECPFFRNSARGGCTDSGYCEMPLGVTQISYKKYTGTPLCHCHGPGDRERKRDCCSEGKYAFTGDEFDD